MKYCSNCSKEYVDSQNFCEDCGLELMPKDMKELEEADEKTKEKGDISALEDKDSHEKSIIDEQLNKEELEEDAYCENCGEKREPGNFCQTCGHPYDKKDENFTKGTVESAVSQPKKQLSPKQRKNYIILGITFVILIALGIGSYKFAENYYSKANQIERYREALMSTDAEKIANSVKSTDKQFKISKNEIKIYSDYLKENKAYLSNLSDNLASANASENDIYLRKNGKYFFLFDKYDLILQPVYFNVETNVNGMSLTVNGTSEEKVSNRDDYTWKLGPLVPGAYSIKGTFDYNGEETSIEQMVEQIDREEITGKNTRNISFEVTKIKVDFLSSIKDGELLVDGTSVAMLQDTGKTPLEMIWRDHAVLQVKQTVGELTLLSEPLDFYEEYYLADDYSSGNSDYLIPSHEFSVSSNISEGTVYLNNQVIGNLTDSWLENLEFVITETPLELKIKQSFDDGSEIESESFNYQRDDYYSTVYMEFETELDEYDISDFLRQFYNDVDKYADDYYDFGSGEILTLESYFENEANNGDFIDYKDNFILPTRSNENKDVSTTLTKVESIHQVSAKTYEVSYIVNYYTTYSDDTNSVDQFFRYKKGTLVLNDQGDIVIRDLGGADNFEEVSEREAY